MSDWSMYELGDVNWEEFGGDDHRLPLCVNEHTHDSRGSGDARKLQWHEVESAEPETLCKAEKMHIDSSVMDGKSPLVEPSWSDACTDIFLVSSDPQHISKVSALASQCSRTYDKCFADSKPATDGNVFCTNDSIIGNVGVSDANKMCQISLADISPEDKELQFLHYGRDRENNVLMDYEWNDIANFENFDKMFRNHGATFGQGHVRSANELSWFSSSSHAADGCQDFFNIGFETLYPEMNALNKSLKPSEADMSFLLQNDSLTEACDNSSSLGYCAGASWMDTDIEVAESMVVNETRTSAITQNRNGRRISRFRGHDMDCSRIKLPKSQYRMAESRKNRLSEIKDGFYVHDSDFTQSFEREKDISSVSSSLETCPPSLTGHENPLPRADCNYSHPYDYHVKMDNDHLMQKIPAKKSASCVKSETESNISPSYKVSICASGRGLQSMENYVDALSGPLTMTEVGTVDKICHKKQPRDVLDTEKVYENSMGQVASLNSVMLQNRSFTSQSEDKGGTERVDMSIGCPKFDIDCSAFQENSTITVLSGDDSLGSASFRMLQDVLDQLDIRTKLCIRDGLYRLARNAEMRHCTDSTNHNREESCNLSEISRMEEPKQSSEFIVETGTNPIDRSIAHLLFYRISDSSESPIDYAMSYESHVTVTNEQNHGSSTNAQ